MTTHLTERQEQILALIADGLTGPQIGRRLHLSPHTVKTHTASLFALIGARSRSHAVTVGFRTGLLALTPVDPTRDPDPELCAGPAQILGVEGWACGRGLALPEARKAER